LHAVCMLFACCLAVAVTLKASVDRVLVIQPAFPNHDLSAISTPKPTGSPV
jgi:hypothetical protein